MATAIIASIAAGIAIGLGGLTYFFKRQAHVAGLENERLRQEKEGLSNQLATRNAEVEAEKREVTRLNIQLENLPDSLLDRLKNISTDINKQLLEENSKKVVDLNKDLVAGEIGKFESRIAQILDELRSQNTAGTNKVSILEGVIQNLSTTHGQLKSTAENLTRALTSAGTSKTQGNWGEDKMRRMLEAAGLLERVHFYTQEQLEDSKGAKLIPDFVIKMPEGHKLIVDSKVSLPSAVQLSRAVNEEEIKTAREEVCGSLLSHIENLATKNYPKLLGQETPEFVVMFVPLPGIIDAACEHKADLYDYALQKKIILAEPRTVMALLLCAANIWRLSEQNKNHGKIIKLAESLLEQIISIRESWIKIGQRLDDAKSIYEETSKKVIGSGGRSLEGYANQLVDLNITPRISKSAGGKKRKNQGLGAISAQLTDIQTEEISEVEEDGNTDGADNEGEETR